jgi:ornithine cyclodeaminase/alanine dehydrogenase-like protein (mu-crystallin family)
MIAETLILTASEVARVLSAAECRDAVERAFARLAEGRVPAARSVGFEAPSGSFHVKVALDGPGRPRFVAKVNGNFPGNPEQHGLPTIQGVLILADARDGRPLAIMDSGTVTAMRTAAASAVAASHLARRDAAVLAVIGCGVQGAAHVEAMREVRSFAEIRLRDVRAERAHELAARVGSQVNCLVADAIGDATLGADVIVTCTSGTGFILDRAHVRPGTFVAAVGADNPHKREVHPSLMAVARVVVDDLAQCAAGGDLHHALEAEAMTQADMHADLATVVAGRHAPLDGRTIVLFDSTGIALEDAAAADLAYERACALGLGSRVQLGE